MNTFNFKQVTPSLFDSGKSQFVVHYPDNIELPIGELVTIGRSKSKQIRAVFIKSDKLTDEKAIEFCSLFPQPQDTALPADCDKVIQYVPSIGGYLFAYFCW